MTRLTGLSGTDTATALREVDPDLRVTLRMPLETTIGVHSEVDRLVAYGQWLGLEVKHLKAGSWFAKSHFLTVDGRVREALRFVEAFNEASGQ